MVRGGFVITGSQNTRLIPRPGVKAPSLINPPIGNGKQTTMAPNQDAIVVPLNAAYHTILRSQQRNRYAPRQPFPTQTSQQVAQDIINRAAQSAIPLRVIQPPTTHQPASSQSRTFTDNTVSATSVRMPAVGAFGTVVTFQVPTGRNAAIVKIANELTIGNYQNGSGNALWYLTVNGMVYPGFNGLKAPVGTMDAPGDYSENRIYVFELDVVQLLIFNLALTPGQGIVQGLLGVYWYPIAEEFASLQG